MSNPQPQDYKDRARRAEACAAELDHVLASLLPPATDMDNGVFMAALNACGAWIAHQQDYDTLDAARGD